MSGLYGAHHRCLGDGHSQTGLWPQPGANPRLHPEAWGAFPAQQTSGDFLKEEKSPHKAAEKAGATLNSCCLDRGEARNHRDVTLCAQRIAPLLPPHRAAENVGDWLTHQHPANVGDAGSATPQEALDFESEIHSPKPNRTQTHAV